MASGITEQRAVREKPCPKCQRPAGQPCHRFVNMPGRMFTTGEKLLHPHKERVALVR